jgi:hypothetical protein
MSEMIDLTEAWLDWKATCAVDACSPENKSKLIKVSQASINEKIRRLNQDQSSSWAEYGDPNVSVSVFHELEVLLYKMQKIKGMPFKIYLFDTIGKRAGGLGKNLTGYLIKTTLVHLFYKNVSKQMSLNTDDKGEAHTPNAPEDRLQQPENAVDENDPILQVKDESFISKDGRELVTQIIMKQWDEDIRLGFFCLMKSIPLSNPDIQPLFKRRKSALADAVSNAGQKMKDALAELDIVHRKDYIKILREIVIPELEGYFEARKEQYAPVFEYIQKK